MVMTYIPWDDPWHKGEEYVGFRDGDLNSFWDIQPFHISGGGVDPKGKCIAYIACDIRNKDLYGLQWGSQEFSRYSASSRFGGWGWTQGLMKCIVYIACKTWYMFLKISCHYLWWLHEEMLKLDVSFICSEWPWTFQNDHERPWVTTPCLKEHFFLSQHQFLMRGLRDMNSNGQTDTMSRVYWGLGWKGTTATVCFPEIVSWSIKKLTQDIKRQQAKGHID
jgi:hypothetical protein